MEVLDSKSKNSQKEDLKVLDKKIDSKKDIKSCWIVRYSSRSNWKTGRLITDTQQIIFWVSQNIC